ncbi:MAG: transcription-repair coupling factor [Candidatus Caenarcaniphilales bacterium]|nr:transcription-repair coupling factor [Candidatus Caenarcaniphilales bacterium]
METINKSFWQSSPQSKTSSQNAFSSLQFSVLNNKITKVSGLVSSGLASFLEALYSSNQERPILYLSNQDSPSFTHKLSNQIKRIANDKIKVQSFPVSHGSNFDGVTESAQHFAQVSEILSSWLNNKLSITVCNTSSIVQPFCAPSDFRNQEIALKRGSEVNLTELSKKLVLLGYRREETVVEVGTFAIRGEILDLFPSNQVDDLPWRINLFGDEVESIRPYEPWTQRSIKSKEVDSICISPLNPFVFPQQEKKSELIERLKSYANEVDDAQGYFWLEDLKKFETGDFSSGEWQRFIPWIQESFSSAIDFFPKDGLIIVDEPDSLTAKLEQTQEKNILELSHKFERNLLPKSQKQTLEKFVDIKNSIETSISQKKVIQLSLNSDDSDTSVIDLSTTLAPQFRAKLDEVDKFIQEPAQVDKEIWVATNDDSLEQLKSSLSLESLSKIHFHKPFGLDRGFGVGNKILLTDYELFNKKSVIGTKKKNIDSRAEDFIPIDLDSIRIGDYLVHLKHGIGRFINMKVIELDNQKREYITVEYHKGDILNVPVDQMNLLTLYKGASEGKSPKLSRLGGIDWEKTKNNVRTAVKKVAFDLLELYANRTVEEGFSFGADTPWQTELEDSFPYKETPDQLKAISEIKEEMESSQIMDRLLCGDVGFGKTEVIIRAAFKAIMAGKQVAVMAPTTILAQQHFKSFSERYEKFPVKIDFLSRAKAGKEKKEIINRINNGETDLVVGTHALLAKSITFKDLALIVVDEEQKFGVNHKEKLKTLKANTSVLTVSATPIPRTMHMAMSGIREMSLISTAPPGRVPIKTQIAPNNLKLVRAAIVREIERGGQIFYLHNRIESIQAKALELIELVPEATYKIAHGRMSEGEISEVMEAFINHEFDVLIATSIIENGIDIPNANTMVIENADRFGLSQLYQLRGRVGRSNDPSRPGFALLLHGPINNMNEQARARLETISRYSNLGSGYQIAIRDMEIRGVGNILGAEQHGKMVTVGFELYCEMLNEAITEIKQKLKLGQTSEDIKVETPIMALEDKPVFDFKLNAYIPIDWISDDSLRMKEYKRLSEVSSLLQLSGLEDEWKDRFGEIPQSVNELIKVVKLRVLATSASISGLIRPKGDFINLNCSKITFEGWKKLQELIPNWLKERIAVRLFGKDSQIMVRVHDLDTKNQLDLLEELLNNLIEVV